MPNKTLYSPPTWDLPLEELAGHASQWGYEGIELVLGSPALELGQLQAESLDPVMEILERGGLELTSIDLGPISQWVAGLVTASPAWLSLADEDITSMADWATQTVLQAGEMAQRLGVSRLVLSPAASIPGDRLGLWPVDESTIDRLYEQFFASWQPVLQALLGQEFQLLFRIEPDGLLLDGSSAGRLLEGFGDQPGLGLAFDPLPLYCLGLDPVGWLQEWGGSVGHVYLRDATLNLSGSRAIYGWHLPTGHPARGWDRRAIGHGGIDLHEVIRTLTWWQYDGPIVLDPSDPTIEWAIAASQAGQWWDQLAILPDSAAEE